MGYAVGIVGDPGSGKSVLSYLLLSTALRKNYSAVRHEADVASPTPPWYLEGLGKPERAARVEELRRRLKKAWNIERAERVRSSLKALKRVKTLVITDMGGGLPPRERVTPENSIILSEVDAVIVVCPIERAEECFEAWRRELRRKAPHVKILAECVSSPDGDVSIFDPRSGACILSGLDRRRAVNPPKHLAAAVERLIDYLYLEAVMSKAFTAA